MPKITAQGKTIDCAVGANLRQVLLAADVDLYNGQARLINCRGIGSCGTCAVQIEGIADAVSVVNWRDGRRPVPSAVWRKFANHFLGRGSRGAWEPGSQKVVLFAPSDTRTIVPVAVCPPTIAMVADRSLGTIGPYGWPAKPEFRGISASPNTMASGAREQSPCGRQQNEGSGFQTDHYHGNGQRLIRTGIQL
jgi:hypothetical protein